jgi:hypothetical protein
MEELEYAHDIVVDMSGCSTFVSEIDYETTSFDNPGQKSIPYHHHHHKNQMNENHAFKYLQKKHERQNCGPVTNNRIDCGWIDGWSWNHLSRCLRTSLHCVLSIV